MTELEQAMQEADAKAEDSGALNRVMQGLREKVGSVRGFVKNQQKIEQCGKDMLKVMEYLQWAKRACIEVDEGKRTVQEFKTAYMIVERAMLLLNGAMETFPKAAPQLIGLRVKLQKQLEQISGAMKQANVV